LFSFLPVAPPTPREDTMSDAVPSLTLRPIGLIRTPFPDKVSTPRQPYAAHGVAGTIELFPGHQYEHALCDLEGWERVWVLFWFHLNQGWRAKVLPPRSAQKRRGVFSTRSPHRPNPIGLSVLRLQSVRGLRVEVLDVDLIDGTPILDIKPYVPYADAFPESSTGWLESLSEAPGTSENGADPEPGFLVEWSEEASAQRAWLLSTHQLDLREPIERILRLGPQPHPYRRIRPLSEGLSLLAVKEWRAHFSVEGRVITVRRLLSGYRAEQREQDPALGLHREFVLLFGA
jgi:tRNA-Thr(GGU) m(6)t(6)A37 methyltransferase TsaA